MLTHLYSLADCCDVSPIEGDRGWVAVGPIGDRTDLGKMAGTVADNGLVGGSGPYYHAQSQTVLMVRLYRALIGAVGRGRPDVHGVVIVQSNISDIAPIGVRPTIGHGKGRITELEK